MGNTVVITHPYVYNLFLRTVNSRICKQINSGEIPTLEFYKTKRPPTIEYRGIYYLADKSLTYTGDTGNNRIYVGEYDAERMRIPKNIRSTNSDDWVCVDDFGAVGDGVTDSTEAIQRAFNSGKPIVVFGSGHYVVSDVITVPNTLKTLDFMYCDLFSGEKLINTKNDGVFDINEESEDMLFIENLYTFEQFYGFLRLIKHSAKRDIVMRNIHNQASATYFNTVGGSCIYMDNCASTTGAYAYNCVLAKDIPYDDYSVVIPYEFHNQKVYGVQINPERAHIELLNDGSEIILDAYKVEGPGVAVKTINGGNTVINISQAAIGYIYADNSLFETVDSDLSVIGMSIIDSPSWEKLRYKYLSDITTDGVKKRILIDEISDVGINDKRLNYFDGNKDNDTGGIKV